MGIKGSGQVKRPRLQSYGKNPFSLKSEVVTIKRGISTEKRSFQNWIPNIPLKCCGWDPNPRSPDVPGLDAPFTRKPYESGAITG